MSAFDLLRAVRDLPLPPPPPKLEASDKLILAILAMRSDPHGFCWTSYTTLAANGWMGVRTAKKSISRLVSAGLVEVRIRRIDDGAEGRRARAANGYKVLLRVAGNEVVQSSHELVPLPHDLVHQLHDGGAATAPGVVPLPHGGGAVTAHRSATRSAPYGSATEKDPFALAGERQIDAKGPKPKATRAAKHDPDTITAKNRIVDAFVEAVDAKKGVRPKTFSAADHAAAFTLAKTYGADEGCSIVRRAIEDDWVASNNCTVAFIASKADTYRGSAHNVARTYRNDVQRPPPGGSVWTAGETSP